MAQNNSLWQLLDAIWAGRRAKQANLEQQFYDEAVQKNAQLGNRMLGGAGAGAMIGTTAGAIAGGPPGALVGGGIGMGVGAGLGAAAAGLGAYKTIAAQHKADARKKALLSGRKPKGTKGPLGVDWSAVGESVIPTVSSIIPDFANVGPTATAFGARMPDSDEANRAHRDRTMQAHKEMTPTDIPYQDPMDFVGQDGQQQSSGVYQVPQYMWDRPPDSYQSPLYMQSPYKQSPSFP